MLINDRNKSIRIKNIIKEINCLNIKSRKDMLNPFNSSNIKNHNANQMINSPIKYLNKTYRKEDKNESNQINTKTNNFLNSSLEITCYNTTNTIGRANKKSFNGYKLTNRENSFYNKKTKLFMNNNIYNELRERKLEENKNKHNFLKLLVISEQEYLDSHAEIMHLTDIFNEIDLIRLKSINNLKFTIKFILECFLFFVNYAYFDWKGFKEKENIFDLKYKMSNIDFDSLDKSGINFLLNKLYKNNSIVDKYFEIVFNSEEENHQFDYTKEVELNRIILFIFKWVKAAFKIYLFIYQKNLKQIEVTKQPETISHYSKFLKNEVIQKSNKQLSSLLSDHLSAKQSEVNNKSETKSNIMLTELEKLISISKSKTDTFNITNYHTIKNSKEIKDYTEKQEKSLYSSNKEVKQVDLKINNFNVTKNNLQNKEKSLFFIPLIENKTFKQLREFYSLPDKKEIKERIERRNFNDISKMSIQYPRTKEKLFSIIESGRMKAINNSNFKEILYNIYN